MATELFIFIFTRRSHKMTKVSIILTLCALFAALASSLIREGRFSGDVRLNEPDIQKCLRSKVCPVTLDLTPTCASDGRTYTNQRVIDCLNECLKKEDKLTIVSGGFCKDDAVPST